MNYIFPQTPPEEPLGKSHTIPVWEEFHCYAALDWGEQNFVRNHASKIAEEWECLSFDSNDTFDMMEYGISDNHINAEDIELYGCDNSLFDNSLLNSYTGTSFYHKNDLKGLENDAQDPWCCLATSCDQVDSVFKADSNYYLHNDTFKEEEILDTPLLEGFVPRPCVFVTVETDEHVVPVSDLALDTLRNPDEETLQEVPEYLDFDGNFNNLSTTLNLSSISAEKCGPEFKERDVENAICVPVMMPSSSISSNSNEEEMKLSSSSDELHSGSQSTIPDYLLDSSQDINTFLFEDISSDESDSLEFDRPMNSCSSNDHTVPRWAIEE